MRSPLSTGSAQTPDFNVLDLDFFASLKSRIWRQRLGMIEDIVTGIPTLSGECDQLDGRSRAC